MSLIQATQLQTTRVPTEVPILDRLLEGGLLPGLMCVTHSNQGARSLRPLLTQLLGSYLNDGIIVIDATNQFPAIQLADIARRQGKNPLETLARIKVLRPFNYHQLTESTKFLESLLASQSYQRLIINGLPDIYQADEAAQNLEYDQREPTFALLELNLSIRHILNLTMKHNLVTVVTASQAPGSRYKPLGGPFLRASAGIIIRIDWRTDCIRWILEKHPFLPPKVVVKRRRSQSERRIQRRLFEK